MDLPLYFLQESSHLVTGNLISLQRKVLRRSVEQILKAAHINASFHVQQSVDEVLQEGEHDMGAQVDIVVDLQSRCQLLQSLESDGPTPIQPLTTQHSCPPKKSSRLPVSCWLASQRLLH